MTSTKIFFTTIKICIASVEQLELTVNGTHSQQDFVISLETDVYSKESIVNCKIVTYILVGIYLMANSLVKILLACLTAFILSSYIVI